MSCLISFNIPKSQPSPTTLSRRRKIPSKNGLTCNAKLNQKAIASTILKPLECFNLNKSGLAIQVGALLATVYEEPAFGVTGVNYEEGLTSQEIIQLGALAFFYFFIMPPIIMNWLRIRWYRRNLLETYFQFMFVFIFFPGIILWAPFLNFRKFPRDPDMKYPWSKPEDPSKIKKGFAKYPYAEPEDYS